MDNPHHSGGQMTTKELEQKILSHFPDANYEIVSWDGQATHPVTLRCLDCGTEKTYGRIYSIWSGKTRFCINCSETKSQQQVKEILRKKELNFLRWINDTDNNGKTIFRVEFSCPRCQEITNRRVWEVIHSNDGCAHCGEGHRIKKLPHLFKKEIQQLFPNQYELLDEYQDAKTKIRVRHLDCGFIFSISPTNLLSGKGCPRCNRYNSKGSKAIKKWLEENAFFYETEKSFDWSEQKRYDFYVPSINLLIEFNGEQHYRPIDFFLQSRSFEEQQNSDIFKEKEARAHGYNFLVIKFDEVDRIPQILNDSTTILTE